MWIRGDGEDNDLRDISMAPRPASPHEEHFSLLGRRYYECIDL